MGIDATARREQKTDTLERLHGGKLRLERRNGSPVIYARGWLQGTNGQRGRYVGKTTGEDTIGAARRVAERWYLDELVRVRVQVQPELAVPREQAITFRVAYDVFIKHSESVQEVTDGQRRNYRQKMSVLTPWLEEKPLATITLTWLEEFRDERKGKGISNATLKKDYDFIRLVLRHAVERLKVLDRMPEFPSFKGRKWAVKPNPRPFLTLDDYRRVRDMAKTRARADHINARTRKQRERLYAYVLLCVGAALRADEAYSIRWCDCRLTKLADADQTETVVMTVHGKHAKYEDVGEPAYALYDAVHGYRYLKAQNPDAEPTDLLFPERMTDGMRELLEACELRNAGEMMRNAKSLRSTGISMRLEQGANLDFRDVAKWARTSVQMIQKFYDQTHPEQSAARVTGFREKPKPTPKNAKEAKRMEDSANALKRFREQARREAEQDAAPPID